MLISVIMPVKNAVATLVEAIESFIAQDWPEKELIVADGMSSDGADTLLEHYASRADIRIIRDKDASATEGLMRGAALARGEVIGLLMADDWLPAGALARVAEAFAADPELGAVSGAVRVVDETQAPPRTNVVPASAVGLSIDSILGVPYPAAFFIRTEVWRALGGFSPIYRYAADRDFLMRCRLARIAARRLEAPLYAYRKHAGSDTLVENESVVRAFLADHVRMAGEWLRHPAITADEARSVRSWRREQGVELVLRRIRSRKIGAAAMALMAQTARDPVALGVFASRATGFALRRAARKSRPSV